MGSPQVEIRNMQESDEERDAGDIELPPPNTEELGLMDEDNNNNNYTEGEDNLEMEAGDIELPSPDLVELASMLDEDSSNNNNTEGEDNMEPADDNVDPDTGEMEVNEIEQETVMDDDRKSNEIQKDNNEETSMDVI